MEIKTRRSILQFKYCLIIALSLSCITVSLQAQDDNNSPDHEGQKYSYDCDSPVKMLDEALLQ